MFEIVAEIEAEKVASNEVRPRPKETCLMVSLWNYL
jgi:hypothetical protein